MKNQSLIKTQDHFNPFSGPEIERIIPTTRAQSELLVDCDLGGNDAKRAYNIPYTLKLSGYLKFNALKQAIKSLIKRHESLRASFSDDARYMTIFVNINIDIQYKDTTSLSETKKEEIKNFIIKEDANYIFDLTNGPLFKVSLIKNEALEHFLILTFHHTICDGISVDNFLYELGLLYSAFAQDKEPNLPEPKRFSLFAEKENLFAESEEFKQAESFWLDMYHESIPKFELPIDNERPPIRTYNNDILYYKLDNNLFENLKQTGLSTGSSIVTTFLSAFEIFLHQLTDQNDIVIGLSTSRHAHYDMMGMIGHTVNALPLRSKIDSKASFIDYLKQRKTELFDAYDHQSISFGHLLQKLSMPLDLSRIPLVPVMVNIEFNNDLESTFSFFELSHELINNHRDYATFEIEVQAHMSKDGPYIRLNYNTSLFKAETIKQMMVSFESLIEKIVSNPSESIFNITSENISNTDTIIEKTDIFNDEEKSLVKNNSNQELEEYSEGKTIIDLFLSQVKKTPNNIALVFENKNITYKELDNLSNKFANHVINSHDVKVNDLVSVILERSDWIIISLLGILKSGAAYVPIEPNYPDKRKNYIIDDSQCKITIDQNFINNFIDEINSISNKPNNTVKIRPDGLCYVIYTSGTTGNPKGVMIEHRNVVSLLYNGKPLYNFSENDVWCMFHSFCFDVSVWEMYGSLLFGGKLIMIPQSIVKDPFEFLSFLSKEGITILNQTPSAFITLIESTKNLDKINLKVRYVIFAGEALYPKYLSEWHKKYPSVKFVNMYGITEITVHATFKEITNSEIESNESNIGTCISTLSAYILNESKKPQPVGVIGELYISGKGVARGYLNRPELTNERFTKDLFNKNERMYRSGDLAKWLPNGEIEFIGRIDDQVKIRGYRVELREVEAALNSLPSIKRSVVIKSNHLAGEPSLVAYLQPVESFEDIKKVRNQLEKILPEFQIPSIFMWLENFPLTNNGKIDKNNLPNPEYVRPDSISALRKPKTKLEKDIAKVWSEYLMIPIIGLEDNFFDIGGTSLIAQKVIAKLRQNLNLEIPLVKIFQFPTIIQFSNFLIQGLINKDEFLLESPEDKKIQKEIINEKHLTNNNILNNTKASYPNDTLDKLILKQVKRTPKKLALEFNDKTFSYEILQKEVNQIAHYFAEQGILPGDFIGVSLPRCPELVPILIAIMQCGAAYMPLDPKYPQSRLDFMLEDSEAKFLITSKYLSDSFSKKQPKLLTEDFLQLIKNYPNTSIESKKDNNNIAYILYTSGSTGKPKGVTITHKNLVNFLNSMKKQPGINETDRLLSITTISFDIATLELFLPLITGATLVLADDNTAGDGWLLLDLLKNKDITILQATPTTWQMLLDSGWENSLGLKALCGGEAMPINLAHQLIDKCSELWNMYGPTETTVWSSIKQINKNDTLITVGKPIDNTQIYIINEVGELSKSGAIGEIGIAGDGVAQGYWKRPDLTLEKFITNAFSKDSNAKLYKTGDLGKILPNGEIQCLGRADHQVKIRGHRIELGEIESVLNGLPNVKQSAVVVNQSGIEARLIAYIKGDEDKKDTTAIRKQLESVLPDILIPSVFMWIEDFPTTPNGKIDKKNLPDPEYLRPESAPIIKKPQTKIEKEIAKVWSEYLDISDIGINDNFFEIGGSSIIAQKTMSVLRRNLNIEIPLIKIFQLPTIFELSEFLSKSLTNEDYSLSETNKNEKTSKDIAIIGMSGRFPGAESIEELWEVIRDGKETISFFSDEELDKNIPDSLKSNPQYVKARGVLPSAKTFDSSFFGINPLTAKTMDPQQRIFLEICWETLEQSGYLPKHYDGRIGVYAGCDNNSYQINNLIPNRDIIEQVGNYQVNITNSKDFIAPRVAFHLNLKGPAISIHSACSTSLLAIAEAVEAIRTGQCDVALAGGASITSPIFKGHIYEEGSIYSPDGHCRPFDATGKGTVFSDGAGVFLIKNLEAALEDGDIIYGLIKGVGINNDGGDKGSFTAPSAQGQAGAITNALNDAQILPSTISYLEAHGTATPIGDPIEMEGLKIAFDKQEKNGYCAIGTIKSNLGHTGAAAGALGLIKTILAMRNKQIPPLVNFKKPNPHIDFENSPFYINTELINWDVAGPRRAGVSSFGVGGTNVHVIVEEYVMEEPPVTSTERPYQILTWSAKSENSLSRYQTALGDFIVKSQNISLADVAYSLNTTREEFNQRSFLISDSSIDASQNLLSKSTNTKSSELKVKPSEIGFLFPGQSAQYLEMGKTLYDNEKVYRHAIDECAELLMADLKLDIRQIIYPESNTDKADELLKNTRFTQPALFVTEYALSKLWMSWGIKPTLLCGHSIGEFVAAHLAGVFNLKDVLHIIAYRGKLVSELPGGKMVSVRMQEENLKEILPQNLSIAAVNSKQLCVVAGTDIDIKKFVKELELQDIPNKILRTSHAFHSFMMEPILNSFEDELNKIILNTPNLPIISSLTGTWVKDSEATSVSYWANHLKNTVRFADAMDTVLEIEDFVLIEVGPGKFLTTLARQQASGKLIAAFPSLLSSKDKNINEYHTLLNTLGDLWIKGVNIDWRSFYSEQKRNRVNLPNYAFDRKLCWVEPKSIKSLNNYIHNETPDVEKDLIIDTDNQAFNKKNILNKVIEIISYLTGIKYDFDVSNYTLLELGLDSLSLTQLSSKLRKEFNQKITFRQINEELPTPKLLADYFDNKVPEKSFIKKNKNSIALLSPNNYDEISDNLIDVSITSTIHDLKPDENKALNNDTEVNPIIINTTRAQSEILTDCFFGGNDAKRAYNISLSIKFSGKLHYNFLEQAIETLVERHETLRSTFSENARLMSIHNSFHVDIHHKDISNLTEVEKQKSKTSIIKEEVNHLFDLVNGPLLKVSLIKIEELEHLLIITLNHTICDGLSTRILIEELGDLYSAYTQGKKPDLAQPDRFSLFAEKENLFIESDEYKRAESFWLNQYKEPIPKIELPIDFPRPKLRTYNSDRLDFILDNNLFESFKKISRTAGSTVVTSLVTAFEVFLYQITGQNDMVLGLTTSRRMHYDIMQMIGHSVNLLPLRSNINTKISFTDHLEKRKKQLFAAYEHQSISFGHLLEKLSIPRDASRIPLVPIIMNVQLDNDLESEHSFFGLSKEFTLNQRDRGTFEIELQVLMSKDGPCFRWNYNTTLFKPETIKQMMASFEGIIEKITSNPNKSISEIVTSNFLSVYNTLNKTKVDYPSKPLHILLQDQADKFSTHLALEFNDTKITYEALHKKAKQIAHHFINEGVNPGDYVGVSLNRGPELLTTLIAVLQCGAAYVPLDPNYPKSRLEYILNDSQAKHLITNKDNALNFNNSIKNIFIEDALNNLNNLPNTPIEVSVSQDNVAYILYTSGSTGKPKGVPITHKNLVNLLHSISKKPGITEKDRFLAITTISFDIAGVELFLPILTGACIVMTDAETARNGELLLKLLETKNISIVQATPTTWKMLLESNWTKPLKIKAFCGGEALTSELAKKILTKCEKLWNMYGPTETTIYSIIKEIKQEDSIITIGKPINNTQLYILNTDDQLVSPGLTGEIVIAGDGVGQGYLNRPDLTSEKFIKNPFSKDSNAMLYRTGDLGKLLPSNEILCLGRLDHQIKIRGYRIEPEEIEKTFISLNDINEAVVLGHNDNLIAFVKPSNFEKIDNEQINQWKTGLAKELPSYFVPSQIKLIKEFPTTPNGKLDRQALLNLETIKIDLDNISKPKTDTQKLVSTIWKKHLNLDVIDIRNNFFELGGNSLIAIQVMNDIENETGERLPLSSLFEYSTIEEFSELLCSENKIETWNTLVPIKPKGNKPPIYIVHGAGLEVLIFNELAGNLDDNQPVYGLQAKELFNTNNNEQYNTIEKIAAHYVDVILKKNPDGPFSLAGYSFGGIIAYEMARKLKELNKKINMVGLFDTVIESHFHYKSPLKKKRALRRYRNKRRLHFFKEMTKSWKNFKHHLNRKKEFILNKHVRTENFNTAQDQLKYEEFLKTEKIIQPIKSRYFMSPQNIEVDLFRAEEKTKYVDDSIFVSWNKFALKGVNIHKIPGNHDTILSTKHIEEVASVFQKVLDLRNEKS